MTISVVGKQDLIALPRLKSDISPLGFRTSYTHPSYDHCYSAYGFAVPLNLKGVPYEAILEERLPIIPPHLKRIPGRFAYLLIDPAGRLWNIEIAPDDKGDLVFDQTFIDHTLSDAWWVTDDFGFDDLDQMRDCNMLTGFLCTNPTPEQVTAFFKDRKGFSQLEWLSITDIVKTINERV